VGAAEAEMAAAAVRGVCGSGDDHRVVAHDAVLRVDGDGGRGPDDSDGGDRAGVDGAGVIDERFGFLSFNAGKADPVGFGAAAGGAEAAISS